MAARSALENKQGGGSSVGRVAGGNSLGGTMAQLLVVAISALLMGVRMGSSGQASFLEYIPVLGWFFLSQAVPEALPMEEIMESM
jgi:hypothetical protein